MKRIKNLLFAALISMTVLSTNTFEVFATTNNSSVISTEMPEKVVAISMGSNDIYGYGAPLSHEKSNSQARFVSGGIDHTHQYIVSNALIIMNNDNGPSVLNDDSIAEKLLSNVDWPDIVGNETDFCTYAGHFYDPDTNTNWFGMKSPTAKSRAIDYFNKAVQCYRDGDVDNAVTYIGRGAHYIADLNEPHHASNKTAINSNHTDFEGYVDDNRASYVIEGNTFSNEVYNDAVYDSLDVIIKDAAMEAKGLYVEASNKDTYDSAASASVENAIECTSKYIYKFCDTVGIY